LAGRLHNVKVCRPRGLLEATPSNRLQTKPNVITWFNKQALQSLSKVIYTSPWCSLRTITACLASFDL